MSAPRFRASTVSAVAVMALLALGCTGRPAASPPASIVVQSSTPTAESTDVRASPLATLEAPVPSASADAADASDRPVESPMAEPPPASLEVDGGDPVAGELGSFTWDNAGSDAPWLPGHPIHIGSTEQLAFRLAARVPIESWHVVRVPSSAVPGGDGAVGMADGSGDAIRFDAPPAGRWSVVVRVRFADHLGDAAYYWAVTVD